MPGVGLVTGKEEHARRRLHDCSLGSLHIAEGELYLIIAIELRLHARCWDIALGGPNYGVQKQPANAFILPESIRMSDRGPKAAAAIFALNGPPDCVVVRRLGIILNIQRLPDGR